MSSPNRTLCLTLLGLVAVACGSADDQRQAAVAPPVSSPSSALAPTSTPMTASAAVASTSVPEPELPPVKVTPRTWTGLVKGKKKSCRYSIEYVQIDSGNAEVDKQLNERLKLPESDLQCADDVEWDGMNPLGGTGRAPPALAYQGGSTVDYNRAGILAFRRRLWADIGRPRFAVVRDELHVVDLAAGGRDLKLSDIVDPSKSTDAWKTLVRDAIETRLGRGDDTGETVVADVAVATDEYIPADGGILLCVEGLPQAFDALGGCAYLLPWEKLAPFWRTGNPLERVRRSAARHE